MKKIKYVILLLFCLLVCSCENILNFKSNENKKENCEHVYTATLAVEPTCIDEGSRLYTCTKCGHMYTEVVRALGHSSSLDLDTVVEASCSKRGYSGDYVCKRCHQVTQKGSATSYGEHVFTETILQEATCTEAGLKRNSCKYCNYVANEVIPATGHVHSTLDQTTVSSTYSGDYKCDVCGSVTQRGVEISGSCTHPSMVTTLSGNQVKYSCSSCGYSYFADRYAKLNVVAFNDFHGQINGSSNGYGPTLAQLASYIKQRGAEPNTLTIDSGDTWQGSLESNENRGNCINDVFSVARLSARTIGNHDFDWGIDSLVEKSNKAYNGYKIPVLAANVYDFNFNTKVVGSTHQDNIGKEYITYTLDNGLKVGIVGVIGKDQITSISTDMVRNIAFTNHIDSIKNISNKLRTVEKCDIVIASCHTGQSDVLSSGLTNISPVSNKKYVDLVLCAHTHQVEHKYENDVLFIQSGCNGYEVGDIELTFDRYENKLSNTSYEYIEQYQLKQTAVNSTIQTIINSYANETSALGSRVLVNGVVGSFGSNEELPNLMCEAMYAEAIKEGYDVSYAYCNNARANINTSTWTMSQLYSAFPFDNKVYIINIDGYQLKKELEYGNYMYRGDNALAKAPIDTRKTYTIAVLDYLAWHTNSSRQYNYFPGAIEVGYLKTGNDAFTYRNILSTYLVNNFQNKTLRASDYSTIGNYRFDSDYLSSSI